MRILQRETFGSWSYVTKRVGSDAPSAEVRIDSSSATALHAFAAANNEYALQLAHETGQVVVRITFRRPLAPDTYRAWAKGAGISYFAMVCLPGTPTFGAPVGMLCLFPSSSDPLPAATLTQAERGLRDIPGIYFLKGEIPTNRLLALLSDSQVLLVDLTDNIVQRNLAVAGVSDANRVAVSNDLPVPRVISLLGQEK